MQNTKFLIRSKWVLLTFSLFFQLLHAQQDTSRLAYFPLHKGDLWQYYVGPSGFPGVLTTARVVVADTVLANGFHYAEVTGSPYGASTKFYRIDSLLRVQEYSGSIGDTCGGTLHETNTFRLDEKDSSTWEICHNIANLLYNPPYYLRFISLSQMFAFGQPRNVLEFQAGGTAADTMVFSYGSRFSLMLSLGFYSMDLQEGNSAILSGAIIGGIQYGTIQTDVSSEEVEPRTFSLSQNYPNPFNSTTIIPFTISRSENIRLAVHDLLGQEMQLLINDKMEVGSYKISFDATTFSTGTYFYTLSAGGRRETKRMMLIR